MQRKGYSSFQNEKKVPLEKLSFIIASQTEKKVPLEKLSFIIASQTEEVMYCRQEKNYGGELVTQNS